MISFIMNFISYLTFHFVLVLSFLYPSRDHARDRTYLSDRLPRVAYRHPGWYLRFVKSQRGYLDARHQLAKHAAEGVLPDLESYIELRRDASGWRMALDMVQYAGDAHVSDVFLGDTLLARLYDHACDIAAWSEVGGRLCFADSVTSLTTRVADERPPKDIVLCAKGVPRTNEANIVTILMRERNVPLECAISAAGTLVRQSVEAFVTTEDTLLSVPDFAADHEVRQHLRGLRDWIAGFVNWLYETQLFLGEKGIEVRTFGWVFIPVTS